MRAATLAAIAGVGAATLAGCAGEDDSAGFGVPTLVFSEVIDTVAQPLEGTVVVESNGCFDLELPGGELRWIVWPEGTRLGDDGDQVVVGELPVSNGDAITAAGAVAEADVLPGWENPDSYFASFGAFCGAEERGIVALEQASVG